MSRLIGIFLVLLGPVLLSALLGCDTCNPEPFRFGIQDYKAYTRLVSPQAYKPYLADTLAANDTTSYKDVELILIGEQIRVASMYSNKGGSSVWACDPVVTGVDMIKKLTVVSDHPYRAGLDAGSNLATILTIGEGPYGRMSLSDFLIPSHKAVAQPFFSLWFTQAPDQIAQHQFKITVDLEKGQSISFLTKPVVIKP